MPGAKKKRTEAKKSAQRARTARNKINAIQRALKNAGGTHIDRLHERLAFWQGKRWAASLGVFGGEIADYDAKFVRLFVA